MEALYLAAKELIDYNSCQFLPSNLPKDADRTILRSYFFSDKDHKDFLRSYRAWASGDRTRKNDPAADSDEYQNSEPAKNQGKQSGTKKTKGKNRILTQRGLLTKK